VITLGEFENAQQNVASHLIKTPIVSAPALGERTSVDLFFKAEIFQKTGSFKPRGSLNKLSYLTEEDRAKGVITVSSGNHAQGLAYAARVFGIPATVVMHRDASKLKVTATKAYGAEVILTEGDLFPVCMELQKERDLTFSHPFDDPQVIAGHGTVGLEILAERPSVDVVFVPIGGGGLISGVATAMKLEKPSVKIIGVEPVGASAMWQSLQRQAVVHLDKIETIAAGLCPPFVGELNLALVQEYVDEVVLVSDEELVEALWLILEHSKLLTEPSGAAGFAGLLFNKAKIPSGSEVVCVLSGGNVDRHDLKRLLERS
jgi:threonine dehydratase